MFFICNSTLHVLHSCDVSMSAFVADCSSWHCNMAVQDWGQLMGPSPHPAHLLPGQFGVGLRASRPMIHRPGRCLGCGRYWNADRPQPRAGCPNSQGASYSKAVAFSYWWLLQCEWLLWNEACRYGYIAWRHAVFWHNRLHIFGSPFQNGPGIVRDT